MGTNQQQSISCHFTYNVLDEKRRAIRVLLRDSFLLQGHDVAQK